MFIIAIPSIAHVHRRHVDAADNAVLAVGQCAVCW